MIRRCITPVCTASRAPRHLMCLPCWHQVPRPVREQVYATWNPKSIRQSPEWTMAVDAALRAVREASS